MPVNHSFQSEEYNIHLKPNQAKTEPDFGTSEATSAVWRSLGNISEQEKIEVIQTGLKVYF